MRVVSGHDRRWDVLAQHSRVGATPHQAVKKR
jgi:hypothetical protein